MLLQQCLLLHQLLVLGLLLLQRDLLAFGYELDLIRNQILQNDLRLLSRVTLFAPVLGLWLGMLSMPFFGPFLFLNFSRWPVTSWFTSKYLTVVIIVSVL